MKANRIALALAMVTALTSVVPTTVMAEEQNTTVKYTGEYTNNQSYDVSVPALLAPEETGVVKLEGIWSTAITMKVTAPEEVTVVNDIDGGEKVLAVNFEDIIKAGDNTARREYKSDVTVGEINEALVGTWEGHIVYTISVTDTATGADTTLNNGGTVTP